MKILTLLALSLFLLGSLTAQATTLPKLENRYSQLGKQYCSIHTCMLRSQFKAILKGQAGSYLSDEQIDDFLDALGEDLNTSTGNTDETRLPLSGVLYTSGLNGSLITDSDFWQLDATVIHPETRKSIKLPELYTVYFENGGIKFQFAYKWMFILIPSEMDAHSLDRAAFGRGLGGSASLKVFPVGMEIGWMPGRNRTGHVWMGALFAGFGYGVHFPKMTFYKNAQW